MLVLSGGACRSVYALFHEWEAKLDLVYKTSVFLSQEKGFFSPHSLQKHLFNLLTEKWISFKAHFKTILIRCVGTKWIGNCCPSSEAGLNAMPLLADGDITVIILAFLHLNFILIKLVCLFTLRGQTQQLEAPWYTCAIATKASCLRVKTSWPLFVVVLCIAKILMSHMPKTCALHCILNVLQDGLGSFSLILGLLLIGSRLISLLSVSGTQLTARTCKKHRSHPNLLFLFLKCWVCCWCSGGCISLFRARTTRVWLNLAVCAHVIADYSCLLWCKRARLWRLGQS